MADIRFFLLLVVSCAQGHSPINKESVQIEPPEAFLEPELRNSATGEDLIGITQKFKQALAATKEDYRLPGHVEPVSYKVDLNLPKQIFEDEEYDGFKGTLELTFKVTQVSREIKLHANELAINSGSVHIVVVPEDPTVDIPEIDESTVYQSDPETDIITILFTNDLQTELTYKLSLEYIGKVRSAAEMKGLYKSYYDDENGVKKYLVTTQFQPVHARKVFPCLDEPSFKATFDISLTHPSGLTAVGNTPSSSVNDPGSETTVTTFATTPQMPTYLIAMIVSEFDCDQGSNLQGDLTYEVCSRPEAKESREYATRVGTDILQSLETFTGITFSESTIGKMHQFAIPDFSAGAMENWGLVTYRETALLWDEAQSSNRYKQRIGTVIAHEFAHMWFGNLITTHWWSDTFLNEGFATYFEAFTTHEVEDTWEMDKQFVIEDHQVVMQSDATTQVHALSHSDVYTPNDISGRFSTISYSKGGSIIRMISHIMGQTQFKQGIQAYLDANRFGNTQPSHLLSALSDHTLDDTLPEGQNLEAVLSDWINKPGFPLVSVKIVDQSIVLSQQRYLSSETPSAEDKWYVPITFTTSTDQNKFIETAPTHWLLPTEDLTIDIPDVNIDTKWIILNNKQAGYYRVDYDDVLWTRIDNALKSDAFAEIDELNRAQIVDDIFTFAKDGKHTLQDMFNIFEYLKEEESYYPWYRAMTAVNTFLIRIQDAEVKAAFETKVLEWLNKVYSTVPFDEARDDDQIYTHKRVLIQTYACRLGNQECITNSLEKFDAYRDSNTPVDKNLKAIVYCNALRHSNDAARDFNFIWSKYQETKLSSEQVTILQSLGCSKDKAVLEQVLDLALDSPLIRTQDLSSVYSYVYTSNPENVDIALDYIATFYSKIINSRISLTTLISGVAGRFTTDDQIAKLEALANNPDLASYSGSIASIVASAKRNIEFTKKLEGDLRAIFIPSPTPSPTTPEPSSATNYSFGLIILITLLFVIKLL